jgi:hypothetical protein
MRFSHSVRGGDGHNVYEAERNMRGVVDQLLATVPDDPTKAPFASDLLFHYLASGLDQLGHIIFGAVEPTVGSMPELLFLNSSGPDEGVFCHVTARKLNGY